MEGLFLGVNACERWAGRKFLLFGIFSALNWFLTQNEGLSSEKKVRNLVKMSWKEPIIRTF